MRNEMRNGLGVLDSQMCLGAASCLVLRLLSLASLSFPRKLRVEPERPVEADQPAGVDHQAPLLPRLAVPP